MSDLSPAPHLPTGNSRGRPATRSKPKPAGDDGHLYDEPVIYPRAAFPTLDSPSSSTIKGRVDTGDGQKRDSMDANAPKTLPQGVPGRLWNPKVGGYLVDGRYVDSEGNTLHFLAKYYDEHFEEYEAEKKDSQGDAKDKNSAFRRFLESSEAQQIPHAGGNGALMKAFEKWWAAGGDKIGAKEVVKVLPDEADTMEKKTKGVKDKVQEASQVATTKAKASPLKFEDLYFKLQWCIIIEVEEDLARYPPNNVPKDAGMK